MVDDLFDIDGDDTVVLRLHVQPGAGRTAVVGRHGDALKVRVAAPPERGRANEACAALVAEIFGVDAKSVELASGDASRSKRFKVSGLDLDDARRNLERAVAGDTPAGGKEPGPGARPR